MIYVDKSRVDNQTFAGKLSSHMKDQYGIKIDISKGSKSPLPNVGLGSDRNRIRPVVSFGHDDLIKLFVHLYGLRNFNHINKSNDNNLLNTKKSFFLSNPNHLNGKYFGETR